MALALERALDAVAGPVADLQPVQLAGDAAQDDAAGGADARRVGLIERHFSQRVDGLVAVEALAPGVQPQGFDTAQLLQAAAFDGLIHGVVRLSLSWGRSGRSREYGL